MNYSISHLKKCTLKKTVLKKFSTKKIITQQFSLKEGTIKCIRSFHILVLVVSKRQAGVLSLISSFEGIIATAHS